MTYTVASICSGTLALDMAISMAFGECELVWVADNDPGPITLTRHRAPGVPNLGDVTTMAWEAAPDVDIMGIGWPCQPVSGAGKQKGMADERWIWPYIAAGIGRMGAPPRLLVLENVPRLLTVDGGAAVAQVVYTLAALGYVGRYGLFRASTAGSCHKRERFFGLAVHRASHTDDLERAGQLLQQQGAAALAGGGAGPAADTEAAVERWRRAGGTELDRHPAIRDQAGAQPGNGGGPATADAIELHPAGWGSAPDTGPGRALALPPGQPDRMGGEPAAPGPAAAYTAGAGPQEVGFANWQPPQEPAGPDAWSWGGGPAADGGEAAADTGGEPGEQWRWTARFQAAGGWASPVGGGSGAGPALAADPADGGSQAWLTEPAPQPWGHDADRGGDPARGWPAPGSEPHQGGEAALDTEGERRWLGGGAGDAQGAEGFERGLGAAERDQEPGAAIEQLEDFDGWCPDEPGRVHSKSGYCCTVDTFLAAAFEIAIEYGDTDAPAEVASFEIDWKEYGPAIRRWELVSGRRAPCPVEPGKLGKPRLSARFAEWMMGLPDGWVTQVPGLTRGAQLKLIGNGVLPLQAAMAIQALYQAVD